MSGRNGENKIISVMHMAFRAVQRTGPHRETSLEQAAPPALTEGCGRGLHFFLILVAPWLFVHVSLHVFFVL